VAGAIRFGEVTVMVPVRLPAAVRFAVFTPTVNVAGVRAELGVTVSHGELLVTAAFTVADGVELTEKVWVAGCVSPSV